MSGEKTEKATPKKRKESRKEGQVARTAELGGWVSLFLVTLALPPALKHQADSITGLMSACLRAVEDPSTDVAADLLRQGASGAFISLIALGSTVLLLSTAITLAQGGFYIASKMAKPDLKKLNLLQGVKRMFGAQAWWELAKMLIKTVLVSGLVWQTVSALMPMLGGLVPLSAAIEIGTDEAFGMLRSVALAGVLMGALDYVMARRRITKATNMTKQEVKDEHKQAEGDPMLKGAIRSRQLAASRNRMIADVAEADVVLVNPTHVAVALRYRPERGAPVVVARGAGAIAARIRAVATDAGVPLVQDVPLARALYRSTEVGMEIPTELFAAVAHVLAFVISRRSKGSYAGTHRSPRSESTLPDVPSAGARRRRVARPATSPAKPSGAVPAGR
jgi:flagellar biosynthetic protein FlhB